MSGTDTLTDIGHVDDNGVPVITGNTSDIAGYWQTILHDRLNITTTLDTFRIVPGVDSGDRQPYYILLGSDKAHNNVSVEIYRIGDNFYFKQLTSHTITCTGCSTGCSPGRYHSVYYCSGGCGNNCSKTETITTKLIDFY